VVAALGAAALVAAALGAALAMEFSSRESMSLRTVRLISREFKAQNCQNRPKNPQDSIWQGYFSRIF
jgi:hypothetical protein